MNQPSKLAVKRNPKLLEQWFIYKGCLRKKRFSEAETKDIIKTKPYYSSYLCDNCNNYHLSKLKEYCK